MQAILLCAGNGTRLGLNIPKCLIKLNNETILKNQIKVLSTINNLTNIIVVAGFQSFKVIEEINEIKKSIDATIDIVINDNFQDHSIIKSLELANNLIIEDEVIRIDGDLFFLKELDVKAINKSTLMVQQSLINKGLSPIIKTREHLIQSIELMLPKEEQLEWICIDLYFNNDFKKIMKNAQQFLDKKYHYLDLINISLPNINLEYSLISNVLEIDTREDLEYAQRISSI